MVWVTPDLNSCRPVRSAARVGAQVGLTWNEVNRRASRAKASTRGVFTTGLPWQEKSP